MRPGRCNTRAAVRFSASSATSSSSSAAARASRSPSRWSPSSTTCAAWASTRLYRRRQLHRQQEKGQGPARLIIPWMEEHDYPLRLTTEASIDLADDPELLELMYRANFRSVFIGIETPREDSLKETKKFQNVRGDSLEAKLARIQRRPRHQRRLHRRFRQRRQDDLRRPVSLHPGQRHHACDGRHAARRFPRRRSTNGWKRRGVCGWTIPTATSFPSR